MALLRHGDARLARLPRRAVATVATFAAVSPLLVAPPLTTAAGSAESGGGARSLGDAGRSAARAGAAPACAPTALNGSAALAGGAVTVSPAPGSMDASPRTQLSLLGAPASELGEVSAVGSSSGPHAGRLLAYSQGDGASFLPDRPFVPGETVTVHATLSQAQGATPVAWSFTVAQPDPASHSLETPPPPLRGSARDHQRFMSRPDLGPPTVTVGVSTGGRAPGDMFLTPDAGPGQAGPMILDGAGELVWFKPLPAGERAANLRVQEYEGRPVLTWWQDPLVLDGRRDAAVVIADSSYRTVAIVRAGNGYKPDLHAFRIVAHGVALMTVYDAIRCDLSRYGGPADGAVADTLVQEIDLKTGLVRFEWHSLDHVALSESYMPLRRSGTPRLPWDWFHINAISPQPDGSLLVDSRNTWAAYEVDARSGQIAWRLGGKRSSFQMAPGTRTAWQHDASWQPNGTITFFDNGATPREHPQSRGIVVRLDLRRMRATLLASFVHPKPLLSASQGDLQPLPGGDWLVGWGQVPYLSELSPSGRLLFDAHLPALYQSYTVLKFPWSAQPAQPPRIALRAGSRGHTTVYASWNGATGVARWRVLAGASPSSLVPVAQAPRHGFETAIQALTRGKVLQAQALDASGRVLASSPPIAR